MSDLVDKMVGRADLRILDGGDSAREAMQEAFKLVLDDMRAWSFELYGQHQKFDPVLLDAYEKDTLK